MAPSTSCFIEVAIGSSNVPSNPFRHDKSAELDYLGACRAPSERDGSKFNMKNP
jgi:hypothetical protein